MFELWALETEGWRKVYADTQRWKVEHEASRWPKWQVEIVDRRNTCDTCGGALIDRCGVCGAPVCCPWCCKVDAKRD